MPAAPPPAHAGHALRHCARGDQHQFAARGPLRGHLRDPGSEYFAIQSGTVAGQQRAADLDDPTTGGGNG